MSLPHTPEFTQFSKKFDNKCKIFCGLLTSCIFLLALFAGRARIEAVESLVRQEQYTTTVVSGYWNNNSNPYAIFTMVSSADYVVGANVLLFSIKKFLPSHLKTQVDFVALLIHEHADNDVVVARLRGWRIFYTHLIKPARDSDVPFYRFKEQFTKLVLWNMTTFTRVLYMDCDTLAVGDVSPLLTLPTKPFAAVRDWEHGSLQDHFNMGVCSLAPNNTEFLFLEQQRLTKRNYRLGMAEQGLLNAIFEHDYHEYGFEYNGNLAAAVQNHSFWSEHLGSLRVIHYTWIKPFDDRRLSHPDYQVCKDALKLWWRSKSEMDRERAR